MNKNRKIRLLETNSSIEEAIDNIREIIEEEQESFDNMPDSLQNSARGDSMLDAIDKMENFISDIECVKDSIEDYCRK